MPSKSRKQTKLMKGAANRRKFAKRAGVPQRVAKEFVRSDKRRGKR